MSLEMLLGFFKKGKEGSRSPRIRGFLFLGAAMLSIITLALIGNQALATKSVLLVDEGREILVQTSARTVGGVLEAGKIELQEKDEVSPSVEAPLEDGMTVVIKRAISVNIAVDGQAISARTTKETVNDVLEEYGIQAGAMDEISPGAEAVLAPGMEIRVARISVQTLVEDVTVDYKVQKQYTTKVPQGTTRVAREGREGTERRTWIISFRDGKEVGRQLASKKVITQPVDKLIMVGSAMVVSRGGENIRYSNAIDMVATAYTHTGRNTASGIYPYHGAVAVDTSKIPMGTKLYVEGYGYATALDRGSAIKGNKIDLFFETRSEAMRWGVRKVKVYVID